MDAKQGTKQVSRSYTDFEPSFEWSRGQESDILRVHLPGFKREHIKVQVDNHGTLRTTGERLIEDNSWRRFGKDFRIAKNSKINGIRAKFENETLVITIPKEITQTRPVQTELPTNVKPAPTPVKPTSAPTPAPAPAPAPREKPTTGKLSDLIGAEKKDEKIRAKKEENLAKKEDEPIQEKITEMLPKRATETAKEEIQKTGTVTGLRNPRKMLILNVVVAILVVVGIGLYTSFKLRKGVIEEVYGEEL